MAKIRSQFVCTACEYAAPKWMGRCPECQAWNTFEEQTPRVGGAPTIATNDLPKPIPFDDVAMLDGGEVRVRTGFAELDTVLGGGLVAGSLVLLGGDPGVGKSTLLLAVMHRFAQRGLPVLYVTGEESARQVHLRGQRLGVAGSDLLLLAHTDFSHVEAVARKLKPAVVVVDSVQTVSLPHIQSIPGSITQIREVAHRAMVFSKETNTAVILVGHVNKSGQLAGPKVLEHFVDTVIYFEGDGSSSLRILRTVKNRFGPSGELGMFEMVEDGLREVPDASARLLQERVADAPGTAVLATLEGTRPLLTEIQALVGQPSPATPSRTCVGVDRTRLMLLAAVLQKAGLPLHDRDIYANAAGGVRVDEPAVDLALVAALASSLSDVPVRSDTLLFGEIGLVGEVRAVSHPGLRIKEAARHGFRRVIAPMSAVPDAPSGVQVVGVRSVRDLLGLLF